MVRVLTILVSTISNSQFFLLKNVISFCEYKSYSHFFQHFFFGVYAIFNNQNFNDTLTNDIVNFEQLGSDCEESTYADTRRLSWGTAFRSR